MSRDDGAIGGNLRTARGDGQTQLVKKVPSGQRFVFFDLRVWSKKVFGSRTRTRVFSMLEFSFFAGAGEYLLTTNAAVLSQDGIVEFSSFTVAQLRFDRSARHISESCL
jgi:hypothetical protein